MIIIQVDKFEDSQKLVNEYDIKTVWETDLPEAKAMHLHPKQMGGAILSLDWMEPKESWKWAGPNWVSPAVPNSIDIKNSCASSAYFS